MAAVLSLVFKSLSLCQLPSMHWFGYNLKTHQLIFLSFVLVKWLVNIEWFGKEALVWPLQSVLPTLETD